MKSLKRTLVLLLSAALVTCAALCVVGCGGQQASSASSSAPASSSVSSAATEAQGKTLVVYYSATGNTAAIAQAIVAQTGATSFVIQPAQPYTSADLEYDNPDSRVSKEHADPALQDVALAQETPDDWASYETVIIGYPIWWGEAAWPVASFVAANDFSGKNVVPFCTSASSGLGSSAQGLQQLAGTGYWAEGMRFSSEPTQEEVNSWIQSFILDTNQ